MYQPPKEVDDQQKINRSDVANQIAGCRKAIRRSWELPSVDATANVERPLGQPASRKAHSVASKPRGRPPGGVRQAARDAGVPEATYRRRLRPSIKLQHPAVATAIASAPIALGAAALLRISLHGTEAQMLAAVKAETISAQTAGRPPRKRERLLAENGRKRRQVIELEVENARLNAGIGQ